MNMSEPIISVSGLRGIVGESLIPEIATRYVAAFGRQLGPGPVVVTRDGRTTGKMLSGVICGALNAIGRDVLDGDVAATPTTGVLVRHYQAAGGIQISASHNPPEYNGIKLFSAEGRVLPAKAGEAVIDDYRRGRPSWASYDRVGTWSTIPDPHAAHLALLERIVDVELIRGRRFTVLLHSNHGSGSLLGVRLLERLGCTVKVVGGEPDGKFMHPPEPTAENLSGILPMVPDSGAQIGFCQDPDADRLAVIDENGRYIGEEYTLAIAAEHVLREARGTVVTNCSTSRMAQDIAEKYGCPFHRSAVGEANVVDVMLQQEAVLGGEGNGGVIDPRVGLVRDSFAGMALLLEAMAARGKPISALTDELPRYEIVKSKITLSREKLSAAFEALEKHFAGAKPDRLDGLRLDWPGKWFLVRPSNTEPIVRAFAEAPTGVEAERICREAAEVLARL